MNARRSQTTGPPGQRERNRPAQLAVRREAAPSITPVIPTKSNPPTFASTSSYRRLRLIHSNCPADDIRLCVPAAIPAAKPMPTTSRVSLRGKHGDDRRRRGVRHPQFTNAERAYALRRQFSRIANAASSSAVACSGSTSCPPQYEGRRAPLSYPSDQGSDPRRYRHRPHAPAAIRLGRQYADAGILRVMFIA